MKKIVLIFFFISTVSVLHAQVVCANIPPVAIAGNDTTIQNNQASCTPVPVTITLNGSNSFDPDGTIVSYLWSWSTAITNPDSAITTVTGLLPGNYLFILKVTDNNGAFAYDTIHISIVPDNRPLVQTQLIPIGTLSQVRGSVTMAASNNKILFAGGGVPPGYCASSRVDIYDINTNSWTTAELSEARYGMGVGVTGNRIFFGGGFSPKTFPNTNPPWCYIGNGYYPDTRSSAVDIYDASSNTWSTSQLSDRRAPEGAAAGNKVIFAGGDISVVAIPSNVINIYDASSNSWTNTTIAEAKSLPQIATANNKIYLAGGGASLDADNSCLCFSRRIDIYDALSDLWSVDSLSMERAEMGSISANNKIYWAGGYIFSTDPNSYYPETTSSVEIRDLATNTTSFDCLSKPRAPVTALKKNNKLLFFDNSATFDIYDLTTNSWSIGVLPLTSIHWYSVFSYNDNVYIAGAYLDNDYVPSNQVWKLEINNCTNSTSSAITASACDAYTLNGKTYRASGLYRQTLSNASGCDSVITLNLTINHPANCTMSVTACNSYMWCGQAYNVSGFYSDTLGSSGGCDSILNLNLTINHSSNATTSITACNSYTWQGQTYTVNGFYSDTLISSNGCDSVLNLNLTIGHSTNAATSVTACDSYTWQGQTYTTSGFYSDTLLSSGGCDSIRTLNLIVTPQSFSSITQSICDGETYLGHSTSGIYIDTFVAANGCDSIRTLQLTVLQKPSPYLGIDTLLCSGDSLRLYPGQFNSYTWQDGSVQNYFFVKHEGLYSVTVSNNCGSASDEILITGKVCDIYFPSAFTPNNDGKNDLFKVLNGYNLSEFRLSVYNRWGQIVFETNDPRNGWNGNFKGQLQNTDVFIWYCEFRKRGNPNKLKMQGTTLLIR